LPENPRALRCERLRDLSAAIRAKVTITCAGRVSPGAERFRADGARGQAAPLRASALAALGGRLAGIALPSGLPRL